MKTATPLHYHSVIRMLGVLLSGKDVVPGCVKQEEMFR